MNEKSSEITTQKAPLAIGRGIGAIVPQDVEQAYRLALIIAKADMAPKSFSRDENKIMVAIMHGLEVGLTPMAALQSIAVINGSPAIWGDGALALVQASGLLDDIEEKIEGEGDARIATCTAWRIGRETPIVRTFSVADAKRANLWIKAGPWTQYPERMLKMRARSWCLRDGFADVLRGLGVVEERRDIPLVAGKDGTYRAEPPPRPTRESVAAKIEPPKETPIAETIDGNTGEVMDAEYRATMRDESGSATAVPPPAQQVDAPSVSEVGSPPPPPATPCWIASSGKEVKFPSVDELLTRIIPGIEGLTPEQAAAARKRNAPHMAAMSEAGHREAMIKLSNALALREGGE